MNESQGESYGPVENPRPLGESPGLNESQPGEYLVSVQTNAGQIMKVEALSLWMAVMRGASRAHIEWAWEAEWPLDFVVTCPNSVSYVVGVELESRPVFTITGSREVPTPKFSEEDWARLQAELQNTEVPTREAAIQHAGEKWGGSPDKLKEEI